RRVADQEDALDMAADDREDALADAARRQRIDGDAARLGVDRAAGGERARQGRRGLRLDADDAHRALMPERDAAQEPAATDRGKQRLHVARLLLELLRQRRLAEQRLVLIEGMDGERARARGPFLAGGERIGI